MNYRYGGHLSTCGRDCTGEPACSERSDIARGATDEQLRARYGPLPVDVDCQRPGCGAKGGETCRIEGQTKGDSRYNHGYRTVASWEARKILRGER